MSNLYHAIEQAMTQDIPETKGFYDLITDISGDTVNIEASDILNLISELSNNYQDIESLHVGNEHLNILFYNLESVIHRAYDDVSTDFYINCLDSHFYVNGDEISDSSDFYNAIKKDD